MGGEKETVVIWTLDGDGGHTAHALFLLFVGAERKGVRVATHFDFMSLLSWLAQAAS